MLVTTIHYRSGVEQVPVVDGMSDLPVEAANAFKGPIILPELKTISEGAIMSLTLVFLYNANVMA